MKLLTHQQVYRLATQCYKL